MFRLRARGREETGKEERGEREMWKEGRGGERKRGRGSVRREERRKRGREEERYKISSYFQLFGSLSLDQRPPTWMEMENF